MNKRMKMDIDVNTNKDIEGDVIMDYFLVPDSLEQELELNLNFENYGNSNSPVIRDLYGRLSNREISVFEFYQKIFKIQKIIHT